jgi:hypothetical protein
MLSRQLSIRTGHSLLELVCTMVAGSVLMAGLASVMFVAGQVAYTPAASSRRLEASQVVNQLADEVRGATFFITHTSHTLEFVVADRDNDGLAERIRYDWSGTAGAPLYKTVNSGTAVAVLASVQNFQLTYTLNPTTTTVTPTVDTSEAVLQSNTNVTGSQYRTIDATNFSAQRIDPTSFSSVPAGATCWNVTKVDFQGSKNSAATETLRVQIRPSGDPYDGPGSKLLGEVVVPESNLSGGITWNTATFGSPVRGLSLSRVYDLAWTGTTGELNIPLQLLVDDSASASAVNVNESSDAGASWHYVQSRQVYYRVYGTYTKPGTSVGVTRNFATRVAVLLQTGDATHSRVDASVPLENTPELLSAYWRADFDTNPTALDLTRDGTLDWKVSGGGTFDGTTLVGGIWHASGALQTQPVNNFTNVTTVEACCRNTSVGGNGAVLQIGADWAGGLHAPLFFRLQLQSNSTQTLTLYSKSDDTTNVALFQYPNLSNDFVKIRLTILPANNLVNLQINGEDQGTFSYTPYAPSADDRYVTMYNDTSNAEFDSVEVRVGEN